jgi:biotin carboxyl carrier protein
MKQLAKISGKKHELKPLSSSELKEWTFERRPGGWVIATRRKDGVEIERKRFFYQRAKQSFFAKFTQGQSLDFYGEKIELTRSGGKADSASDYTAQFPGKVRKVLVKDSDAVKAGTALLMVEAMKMEFAIKAGADGTVKRVLVQEGMILAPGQQLVDFEESQ